MCEAKMPRCVPSSGARARPPDATTRFHSLIKKDEKRVSMPWRNTPVADCQRKRCVEVVARCESGYRDLFRKIDCRST